MRSIKQSGIDFDGFYTLATKLGVNCMSTEELEDALSKLISTFLNERDLALSERGRDSLQYQLSIMYYLPERLLSKDALTRKQTKSSIKNGILEELYKLQDAFNITDAANLEIALSLYAMRGEDESVLDDSIIRSLPRVRGAIGNAIKQLEKHGAEAAEARLRKAQPQYIDGSIDAYQQTICKENPKAGFSRTENADLFRFMLKVVFIMEPEKEDPGKGLRGRIQTALEALPKTPPNRGG